MCDLSEFFDQKSKKFPIKQYFYIFVYCKRGATTPPHRNWNILKTNKKHNKMKKMNYVAPEVEMAEMAIESGIAASVLLAPTQFLIEEWANANNDENVTIWL